MVFAGRRGQLEVIAIDRRIAGFRVRLDPLPGAEGDEVVAAVVDGRAQGLRVGIAGIELRNSAARSLKSVADACSSTARRSWAAWRQSCPRRGSSRPAAARAPACRRRRCRQPARSSSLPSTTGEKPPFLLLTASRILSVGSARNSASDLTPSEATHSPSFCFARFQRIGWQHRRRRPRRFRRWPSEKAPAPAGEAISVLTAKEPALSPKMVTLPGSPPKCPMLALTHCSAAT